MPKTCRHCDRAVHGRRETCDECKAEQNRVRQRRHQEKQKKLVRLARDFLAQQTSSTETP